MPTMTPNKTTAPKTRATDTAPATVRLMDPIAATARQKLHDIETELNATFAEREREIRGLMIALVAREHVLLLGPAGTGKSALAQTVCKAIQGGEYFERLLTRFSVPEEVFGAVSLSGMKEDKFRRVTTAKLPEAHVGFLDEIFKANSAILNSLLTILNERAFDNDGARTPTPLETLVGASNELPEGPELAALFDRFLLRFWTGYTRTQDSFERLLIGDEPTITTTLDLTELAAAQVEAAQVVIPTATVEELFKLRAELNGAGCAVSDRRWRKAAKILRATAWLEGAAEVTPDVFPILAHVLWDLPDQQSVISQKVARYASAELAEAQEAFDAIAGLMQELPATDTPEFAQRVTGVTREMKKAQEKIAQLGKAAKPAIKTKIDAIGAELDRKYKTLREQAAKALGL
jgi:MoxR-like ATPase